MGCQAVLSKARWWTCFVSRQWHSQISALRLDVHHSFGLAVSLYFFDQAPWLLFFFLLLTGIWGRLLFEGGIYFFGKPADINNSWLRYIQVRQWQLLDAVSSMCSLSVLLSSANLVTVIICTREHLPYILAAATIRGRRLFHSELPIMQLLFEGGVYSKKYSIKIFRTSYCYATIKVICMTW